MMDYDYLEEDTLYVDKTIIFISSIKLIFYFSGLTITSGTCTLKKDSQNLVGISIGGGAPYCPCLYVVQIFDNTPASKDGTIAAGEIHIHFS
jgi:hypothetical protein